MNPTFWKNKRVFVTGHTGFKGSWLCLWLQHMGAEVCGYSLQPPTKINNFTESNVAQNMTSVEGDIRNLKLLNAAMTNFWPDIVVHMAAQPLVRLSYQEPHNTIETNVMGTVNVLEAAKSIKSIKAIVNVTTDKCYENKEWPWGYREDEAMGGHDPYSASKGCSELITSAYRKSFFTNNCGLASARAGNVIGGGDWAEDRIIPDILRSFINNTVVDVRYPDAIRPWQHVLEPLAGYLLLAEKLYTNNQEFASSWNFGPTDEDAKSVRYILDYMNANWNTPTSDHLHEAHYLKLDISKAKTYLKWKPRWSLNTALDATLNWHNAWINKEDMKKYSITQIENYMNGEKND